jgi:phosphate transport system permease protein
MSLSPLSAQSFEPAASDFNILNAQSDRTDRGALLIQLVKVIAVSTIVILLWLFWTIFNQARPAIAQFGLGFLSSKDWDPGNQLFGALPYIYGTLVSSALALLFAIPIALAVAIVTSEKFLPKSVQVPIVFLIELIASIPSVIIGFWGSFVLVPALQPIQIWLFKTLGWIPLFSTESSGKSMLVAAVVLTVMILPTIASISRDVMRAVPRELCSASMALGATRWEMIFSVLLPSSFSGIVGAVMLGLGRALGETMAVTMVIGNSDQISASLLDAGNTIPALLANQFAEAAGDLHVGSLMYLTLILFALTLIVNVLAGYLVKALSFKQ